MKTQFLTDRHIGINSEELTTMLECIGSDSLDELIEKTVPQSIRLEKPMQLPETMSEPQYLRHISQLASRNRIFKNYIGQGWYESFVPAVIQRNVFENPVWYTSYTPYQAEISQGRLEALILFQTMVSELTALPLANCSLLDEGTAAAEAATMMYNLRSREQQKNGAVTLFVDENIFQTTLDVINTRMIPQGITIKKGSYRDFEFTADCFGAIIQYPDSKGTINDYRNFTLAGHQAGVKIAVAADLLSLTLLSPPGEWDADICFGSAQRMGIPMYFGGPSAAFFATRDEYKRNIPGRIIGYSTDVNNHKALRLALQTREQHIKREKATSNICTAQALMAMMSGLYAAYMGPEGLLESARGINNKARLLGKALNEIGFSCDYQNIFDTLYIKDAATVRNIALQNQINLYYPGNGDVMLSINETTTDKDLINLFSIFAHLAGKEMVIDHFAQSARQTHKQELPMKRESGFMQQKIFNLYHTETEMMRYIKRLERKDISLAHSMIPLGSCTMKMNAAAEMLPLNDLHFQNIHPFAPEDQVEGYLEMIENLSQYLAEITGMKGVSLQPNSGAAGEYAGLRTIRSYLNAQGQGKRNIVLIPASAHGTNPASAAQCGFSIAVVACDQQGNVDMTDLKEKISQNRDHLAALMITYPSTHGIFEESISECCRLIHQAGAQVYMDGANMNAQVGLTSPGHIGADICHLNLHKTFAMPHGGGGPGVGPICAKEHLVKHLPGHIVLPQKDNSDYRSVASAPYGSAGLLAITYGYIRMMGAQGLTQASCTAILNANYLAARLGPDFGIVYKGENGFVGHELILDCRGLKEISGVDETDISKRLMDFGYHAPTLSFPVHGTLMIEPTESESLAELDRFCDAMYCIFDEIKEIENHQADIKDNVLKNAPHPQYEVCGDEWLHPYSRQKAAFPLAWLQENKFWTNVGRIDNALGDRNLIAKIQE